MNKIVSFGEIMLRLAPNQFQRFVQAEQMEATYGGGEANVAVSLAELGEHSVYVTKLPKHDIGQAAVNALRRYGVDTNYMVRGGERVGIYFLEKGASQRPSKVIYDRKDSAISLAASHEFDWDSILKDTQWFHLTGITPALSDSMAQASIEACQKAQSLGIPVSCDLNYRNKLWTKDKARSVMTELMKHVDVCIANEEDAKDVFGIVASQSDLTSGDLNHEAYVDVAKKLMDLFRFKSVAITLRRSLSASINGWAGLLYTQDTAYFSPEYTIQIVDRVGGGDSFGAGLIYSMLHQFDPQKCIDFAVSASCLKHSIEGDFNHVSLDEVTKLMSGDGSGRVQR